MRWVRTDAPLLGVGCGSIFCVELPRYLTVGTQCVYTGSELADGGSSSVGSLVEIQIANTTTSIQPYQLTPIQYHSCSIVQ